jgi:hypothetical protein
VNITEVKSFYGKVVEENDLLNQPDEDCKITKAGFSKITKAVKNLLL